MKGKKYLRAALTYVTVCALCLSATQLPTQAMSTHLADFTPTNPTPTPTTPTTPTPTTPTTPTYKDIAMDQDAVTLAVGQSVTLSVTGAQTTITWASSDDSIVTVSGGAVTAVKKGTATVTAKANGGKVAVCAVNVENVKLSKSKLTLVKGEQKTLTLKGCAHTEDAKWKSSKSKVVSVDKNGNLKALKKGTANITATVHGKKLTCKVTVYAPKISAKTVTLNVGEKTTLKLTGWSGSVKWKSGKKAVATVTKKGVVKAVKSGSAKITATVHGKSYSSTIKVAGQSITITPTTTLADDILETGKKATFEVTYEGIRDADKAVTWDSSNSAVATIAGSGTNGATGTLTAVKAGTVTITATCGSVTDTYTVTVKNPKSISLNKSTLSLKVGGSETLTVSYADFLTSDSKITTWSSSNSTVASVAGGKVTAKAAGTATITATCGSLSAKCTVTVTADKSIALNTTAVTLTEGDETTLTVKYTNFTSTDSKTTSWKSSNTAVATVSTAGKVTAVKAGTATITATCGSLSAKCTVTVKAKTTSSTSIRIDPSTLSLGVNEEYWLYVYDSSYNAIGSGSVTWTSSNTSVATVTSGGMVTGKAAGTTTITAKYGTLSATCSVTVTGAGSSSSSSSTAKSIAIVPSSLTVEQYDYQELTVEYYGFSASDDKTITWSSSDTSVATIYTGTFYPWAVGTTTITAKCGNLTATCLLTVVAYGSSRSGSGSSSSSGSSTSTPIIVNYTSEVTSEWSEITLECEVTGNDAQTALSVTTQNGSSNAKAYWEYYEDFTDDKCTITLYTYGYEGYVEFVWTYHGERKVTKVTKK